MHGPGGNATCEPAECAAKGHNASALRGSGNVQTPHAPKTARNPLTEGKTQARGGTEQPSDLIGLGDTCSQSTTTNNRGDVDRLERSLKSCNQLDFWDLT